MLTNKKKRKKKKKEKKRREGAREHYVHDFPDIFELVRVTLQTSMLRFSPMSRSVCVGPPLKKVVPRKLRMKCMLWFCWSLVL